MTEAYAQIDRNAFPLIKITFTGAKATDENFSDYLKELEKNYERQERLGLLFDAGKALFPGVRYQKQQADWMNNNEDLIKSYCVGIAYVVPSLVLRKALQLIFNLSSNPVPFKVFKNVQEGESWLKQELEQK